jgi:glucose/arabinose dehydrogenase
MSLVFDQNLLMLRAFQNDGGPSPAGQGDAGQQPLGNHDGGAITFGADGKLYVLIGDVGRRGQMQNLPSGPTATGLGPTVPDDQFGGPEPDDGHFTGVIVRLNDDGTTPADNPFFADGAVIGGEVGDNIQRLFAFGIRNSFGMAVDPFSGRLWATENGDSSFDELNLVLPGFNSGWVQLMGPLARLAQFKNMETTLAGGNLQQLRWSPGRIANTSAAAVDRLMELTGSQYSDPEFSWKFAVAPTALDFVERHVLGSQYFGDLVVGNGAGQLMDFDLGPARWTLKLTAKKLRDRVDDNSERFVLNQSQRLVIGDGFGIITDVEAGPSGRLYVCSLDQGTVYEVFRITHRKFGAHATGGQHVPTRATPASSNIVLELSKDKDELSFRISAANLRNVVAVHLHLGDPGQNGPMVATLFGDSPGGGKADGLVKEGTLKAKHLKGPMAGHALDDLVGALLGGDIYVDIHTNNGIGAIDTSPGDFASGELRGQLWPRLS